MRCAAELGTALARRGLDLVYGGSAGGIMGAVASGVRDAGGYVIGVIPGHLTQHDPVNVDVNECHVVETMHERKALMYQPSASFIALPGGFGTLDELFETLTWHKLGLHRKPIAILNVAGYFDPLADLLDRATAHGFLSTDDRQLVHVVTDVAAALQVADPDRLVRPSRSTVTEPAAISCGRLRADRGLTGTTGDRRPGELAVG